MAKYGKTSSTRDQEITAEHSDGSNQIKRRGIYNGDTREPPRKEEKEKILSIMRTQHGGSCPDH